MNYPIDLVIQYTNDFEYRASVRQLFSMSDTSLIDKSMLESDSSESIDPITLDENLYDPDASTKILDFIYANTRADPLFQRIYKHAAGFMFSEDPDIGLAVLFSYDYLVVFHPVLCAWFRKVDVPIERTAEYNTLAKKLGLI